MGRGLMGGFLVLTLAGPAGVEAGPKKPRLVLRASPRLGIAPAHVLATAEDFYRPLLEWDWDDGTRNARETDCSPFESGAILERYFTADHVYSQSGRYNVSITLREATRLVARASFSVGLR